MPLNLRVRFRLHRLSGATDRDRPKVEPRSLRLDCQKATLRPERVALLRHQSGELSHPCFTRLRQLSGDPHWHNVAHVPSVMFITLCPLGSSVCTAAQGSGTHVRGGCGPAARRVSRRGVNGLWSGAARRVGQRARRACRTCAPSRRAFGPRRSRQALRGCAFWRSLCADGFGRTRGFGQRRTGCLGTGSHHWGDSPAHHMHHAPRRLRRVGRTARTRAASARLTLRRSAAG